MSTTIDSPDVKDDRAAGPSPRSRQPKPPSKKSRDKQRSERFREKQGARTMADLNKELDKTLFFGFNMETEAIRGQQIRTTPAAKILPVSTRSIGFTLQGVFTKLHATMRNLPECTVYQAYRVSLAQMEYKLLRSNLGPQVMNTSVDTSLFYRPSLSLDTQQAVLACPINFNVIASAINATGNFEYGQTQYYPKVAKLPNIDPTVILFSNLEHVVRALSRPQTPVEVRKHFYENNPLPGARWNVYREQPVRRRLGEQPDINPILENPEDFWPTDYGIDSLEYDIQTYNGLLAWVTRKSLKYVNVESKINFDGPGSKTALISNKCADLRNSDVYWNNETINWTRTGLPRGTLDEFWSPESVEDTVAYIGALQLLGEIPPKYTDHPVYRVRTVENASMRFDHKWTPMFINMMG